MWLMDERWRMKDLSHTYNSDCNEWPLAVGMPLPAGCRPLFDDMFTGQLRI